MIDEETAAVRRKSIQTTVDTMNVSHEDAAITVDLIAHASHEALDLITRIAKLAPTPALVNMVAVSTISFLTLKLNKIAPGFLDHMAASPVNNPD